MKHQKSVEGGTLHEQNPEGEEALGPLVCQHPHGGLRNWAAEAVTSLVKAVLNHKFEPPLHQNVKLQVSVLAPLQELSGIAHGDIRQRQLDCVLQVLHCCGDTLQQGWPLILGVIGAVSKDHNEKLVQMAFQCLQLVVTDYLPVMGSCHLEVVVEVAARFGLQTQELNVSLTAIGLLWNISDNFFQNRQRIKQDLDRELPEKESKETKEKEQKDRQGQQQEDLPPFDALWMCLFRRLGDLCVDSRPAVRKSAGQTLFSTVSAHGGLLQRNTWRTVLWKVLFPLLERVKKLSSSASTSRDEVTTGNILIHHSRDTAEKQWAETRVLSLAGVARTFNAKRRVLQQLGDFPRAWSLLLEYIETSALCRNAEVSLAALKSFQEILQISRDGKDKAHDDLDLPQAMLRPPSVEEIQRTDDSSSTSSSSTTTSTISDSADNDIPLWSAAWRVWLNIGTNATRAPEVPTASATTPAATAPPPGGVAAGGGGGGGTPGGGEKMYVPSQHFLTALLHTFPALFEHIKARFVTSDLQQFSRVLHAALSVPVHGDASPFIIPSFPEVTITPLQEASLLAMDCLVKAVRGGGSASLQSMYPDLFEQLLTCATFGVQAPSYGAIQAKSFGSVKGPQVDWVTMNFVPFSERAMEMVVEVYREACSHPTVIQAHVLHSIIKMLRLPLGLKYDCPSSSTWQEAVTAFHAVLTVGLPVARKHVSEFEGMWHELGLLLEDFLFTKHPSPPTLSMEDFTRDEAIDCKMVHLIRDEILPYAGTVPASFVVKVMELLNRGSIHSAMSDTFVDTDSSRKLREDFAKTCFETLLQFSFVSKKSEEGAVTKVAVLSLLQRCQEVVKKYVDDERLSGKCPLPRPRLAEITAVLKAITTLLQSLKKAPSNCVEAAVWQQVIALYPALVECTTSSSPHVTRALKDALHEYRDLLTPPSGHVQNGR
ncbi:protein MON2 homolog [Babylonia areolata]|uniref:protein MON2 homolog n=1 Tax=Babylonia areolata TaxID=304850 RepID=UPI003FD19110